MKISIGLVLVLISFVYSLFLNISFFSKKHVKSLEINVFGTLMVANFIGLIIEFLCIMSLRIYGVNNIISVIINKIFLIYLFLFAGIFSLYVILISTNKINDKSNNFQIFRYFLAFIITIIIVLIFLPFNLYSDNGIYYSFGPCVNFIYLLCSISAILCIFVIIKNIRNIRNKKYVPLIAFVLGTITTTLIQKLYPAVTLATTAETFLIFIMYHTIENPDVKMIEQLEIAKSQADRANRAKTDFLSSMSHEIRTPLNAIVGFSDCITQAETLEEAKENANDIVSASQTLLEIVNGILDISKIEAGKIEIINTAYSSNELFTSTAKLIKARLGSKPLDFKVYIAPDIPPTLYGDHANLKKILVNILTNAVKYTDQGFVDFKVNCVINGEICRLMISVEDSGRGIKAKDIDKLFTKFQRLDEDRNTTIEGTGLGLAITKQLVEMMGGKIIVQSVYGKGSKFTVALDQRIEHKEIVEQKVEIDNNLDLSNKKILVVDDNKLNLKVAAKILSTYKPIVEVLDSGEECIQKIKDGNKYDLILMDDMMPHMRGTEVLNNLKNIEGFNTPVIALTANAITGMREKYLKDGFNDYLSKPIEKLELYKVLNKYLNNKENIKENSEYKIDEVKQPEIKQPEIIQPEIKKSEIEFYDLSNKKVLVVDDNKLNLKVASNFLKPYNLNVDTAESGFVCIDMIKHNGFYDLILMDDMMPDMSGTQTLKKLKEEDNYRYPIVVLTANAIEGMREKYLKDGFTDYLSKPIDKKELNRVLKEVLVDELYDPIKNNIFKEEIEIIGEDNKLNQEYLKNNNVDLSSALNLLGDIDIYNDVMREFKKGLDERLEKLRNYKDTNNMNDYAIIIHSIKSDSKYLGFTKLADLSYNHEMKAKENDINYINENYDSLMEEFKNVKDIMTEYLD